MCVSSPSCSEVLPQPHSHSLVGRPQLFLHLYGCKFSFLTLSLNPGLLDDHPLLLAGELVAASQHLPRPVGPVQAVLEYTEKKIIEFLWKELRICTTSNRGGGIYMYTPQISRLLMSKIQCPKTKLFIKTEQYTPFLLQGVAYKESFLFHLEMRLFGLD